MAYYLVEIRGINNVIKNTDWYKKCDIKFNAVKLSVDEDTNTGDQPWRVSPPDTCIQLNDIDIKLLIAKNYLLFFNI